MKRWLSFLMHSIDAVFYLLFFSVFFFFIGCQPKKVRTSNNVPHNLEKTILSHTDNASKHAGSDTYIQMARTWSDTYIFTDSQLLLTESDIITLAYFIYCAYERSQATLAFQQHALIALDSVWHGWHNLLSTRRNPSKKMPHCLNLEHEIEKNERYWLLYQHYEQAAQHYDQVLEYLVKSNHLSSQGLRALEALRAQARSVIVDAVTDIEGQIHFLLQQTVDKHTTRMPRTIQSLLDRIKTLIKSHGLVPFAKTDNLNTQLSRDCWNLFCAQQRVGNYTWDVIEKARSSFFYAHYCIAIEILENIEISPEDRLFIDNNTTVLLPVTLSVPIG